jgi:hypothetical protein
VSDAGASTHGHRTGQVSAQVTSLTKVSRHEHQRRHHAIISISISDVHVNIVSSRRRRWWTVYQYQ